MVNMFGQATWIQLNFNSYLCKRVVINYQKRGRLKALVWFWWIDETLSANLVYQSDYEIGSTNPSGGANEDQVDGGDGHGDQVLGLEKKKEKNKKLKAKVKLDRSLSDRDT